MELLTDYSYSIPTVIYFLVVIPLLYSNSQLKKKAKKNEAKLKLANLHIKELQLDREVHDKRIHNYQTLFFYVQQRNEILNAILKGRTQSKGFTA
jgi:hypothetical protein